MKRMDGSTTVTIRIDKAKLEAVKYAAWLHRLTTSEYLRRAIETALDNEPETKEVAK